MEGKSHYVPGPNDPARSKLDPLWPPAPPPKGRAAKILKYLLRKQVDKTFGFFRVVKPIFELPNRGPVFVSRFRDVQEVLQRPEIFAVLYAPMIDRSVGGFMLAHDGAEYNKDKGLMRSLMRKDDLPRVRKMVGELAERCIEEGYGYGSLEVVSNLSRKVPILLTGEYFGFPGPDLESMFRWSRATQYDMFHNQSMSGKIHDENLMAGREMKAYLKDELIPMRRRQIEQDPGKYDDVVSRLVKMKLPKEIGFDEDRVLSNIMGLLVGGVETTSNAIVNILDELFRRPKQLKGAREAALANDDHLLFKYCWEALRFNPINPFVVRQCTENYRLASGTFRTTNIEPGRIVFVGTRSAMRDSRELPKPKKFRIDRPEYHYMHMGYGLHRCLGDHISEVQIPEIIKHLLVRKNLRRADGPEGQPDYDNGPFPESFSVMFDGTNTTVAKPEHTAKGDTNMSNHQNAVAKTLKDYAGAFLSMVPSNSVPYFNLPLMFISDQGVFSFTDKAQLEGFLTKYMEGLKAMKYKRVELSTPTIEMLNDATSMTRFSVIRYDEADKVIGQFDAVYTFRRTGDDWKIAVAILLNKPSV